MRPARTGSFFPGRLNDKTETSWSKIFHGQETMKEQGARELGNPRVMNIILLGVLILELGLQAIENSDLRLRLLRRFGRPEQFRYSS